LNLLIVLPVEELRCVEHFENIEEIYFRADFAPADHDDLSLKFAPFFRTS